MAIWPFNRKKLQKEVLPEEVQEYYDSTRRGNKGVALLLALGTLVATVILAVGLFYGGKWIFSQFGDDNKTVKSPTTTNQPSTQKPSSVSPGDDQNSSSDNSGASQTPGGAQPTTPTPVTGPSGPEVPDTGPGPGGLQ